MAIGCVCGLCFDVGLVVVSKDSVGLFEFIAEQDVGKAFKCGAGICRKFVFECFPVDGSVHIFYFHLLCSISLFINNRYLCPSFTAVSFPLLTRSSIFCLEHPSSSATWEESMIWSLIIL